MKGLSYRYSKSALAAMDLSISFCLWIRSFQNCLRAVFESLFHSCGATRGTSHSRSLLCGTVSPEGSFSFLFLLKSITFPILAPVSTLKDWAELLRALFRALRAVSTAGWACSQITSISELLAIDLRVICGMRS